MPHLSLSRFADRITEIMPVIAKKFLKQLTSEFYKGVITLPQFIILDILNRQGESKMTDMARSLSVTTAAMTGIADRLVRDGYAVRVYDPKDRRIVKIGLSAKGSRLVRKIITKRREVLIDIFGKVSERDRQDYLRVLTNIRDILTRKKEHDL